MKYKKLPSVEYLNQIFDLYQDLGLIFWKTRPIEMFSSEKRANRANSRLAGKEAGYILKHGKEPYRTVTIGNKAYLVHRIIMLLLGHDPELLANSMVDHINGDTLDNRPSNLRLTDHTGNQRNKQTEEGNVFGVTYNTAKKKWTAVLYDKNKHVWLGSYIHKEDAVKARKKAEKEYGYHPMHGKVKKVRCAVDRLLYNYYEETDGHSPTFSEWFCEKYCEDGWDFLLSTEDFVTGIKMIDQWLLDSGCRDTIPKRVKP